MTQKISTFENGVNDPRCTPRPTGFDEIPDTHSSHDYGWFVSSHFNLNSSVASNFTTLVDTEGKLSVTADAAHDGSGGLLYSHNSTTAAYGRSLLGDLGYNYTRACLFWVDISNLHVSAGKSTTICRIISTDNQSTEEPAFDIDVDGEHPNQLKFSYYTKTSWIHTPVKTLIGYSEVLSSGYHHVALGVDHRGISYPPPDPACGPCNIMVDGNTAFHLTNLSNAYAIWSYIALGCITSNDTAPSGTVRFDSVYGTCGTNTPPVPSTLAKKTGNYGAAFFALDDVSHSGRANINFSSSKESFQLLLDVNISNLIMGEGDNETVDICYSFNNDYDVGFAITIRYSGGMHEVAGGAYSYAGTGGYTYSDYYQINEGWNNLGIIWEEASGQMSLVINGVTKEAVSFLPSSFGLDFAQLTCEGLGKIYGVVYMDNIIESDLPPAPVPEEEGILNPTYNYFNQLEMPGLILCTPNKLEIYPLGLAYEIKNTLRYNALSELEFTYARMPGSEEIYDAIQGKMVVLVGGVGYYLIESAPEELTGGAPIKKVTCRSLEAEMISRRLTGFEGVYEFSDLLETVIKLSPTWSIGTISPSLLGVYRVFKSNNSTLYNFLMTTMEKAYNCIFLFNSFTKTISAIPSVIPNPDTNIYISLDNLASKIDFTEITDEICTALYCYGGKGLDIAGVNPLGTKVIYNFDYFKTSAWMSAELIAALNDWEDKVIVQQPIYADMITQLNNFQSTLLDDLNFYDSLTSEYASLIQIREVRVSQGLSTTAIDIEIANKQVQMASALATISSQQASVDFLKVELRYITCSLAFSKGVVFEGFQSLVEEIGTTLSVLKSSWYTAYTLQGANTPNFNLSLLESSSTTIDGYFSQAITTNNTLLTYITNLLTGAIPFPPDDSNLTAIVGYLNTEISVLSSAYALLQTIIPNTQTTMSINDMMVKLGAYKTIIYYTPNMTESQYLELTTYIYENTYTNDNIQTYDGANIQETLTNLQTYTQQLYDQSLGIAERVSRPRYEFSGNFSNLLALKEFLPFTNELDLGKAITIGKDNDLSIISILLELEIKYDNPSDFNLIFSSSLRLDNSRFIYGDLMGAAAQLGANQIVSEGSSTATVSTNATGAVVVDIGTSGHTILNGETELPQRTFLSFTGALAATDDVLNNRTTVRGITLASLEHGLSLTGAVLDSYILSTHKGTNADGGNIWIGGGGESSLGEGGQTSKGSYNTSLGIEALLSSTLGYRNTAIGYQSMYSTLSGYQNVGVGAYTLHENTGGYGNTAIGYMTLYYNEDGYSNTALGINTMRYNAHGSRNTAIGNSALDDLEIVSNTDGSNTALGYRAGLGIVTGINNTIIGAYVTGLDADTSDTVILATGSGSRVLSTHKGTNSDGYNIWIGGGGGSSIGAVGETYKGAYNVSVGMEALQNITTGFHNTAIGTWALGSNTTGVYNFALGTDALWMNSMGNDNVGIGAASLYANTKGGSNIAIGSHTLELFNKTTDTATYNIAIGRSAGASITTGINNTIIGSNITGVAALNSTVLVGYGNGTVVFKSDGYSNLAIGENSFMGILTDTVSATWGNIAMGKYSLQSNLTGSYNIALGYYAMNLGTAPSYNIAIGASALKTIETGQYNVAIGGSTMFHHVGGYSNVAIGDSALHEDLNGQQNVAIGVSAFQHMNIGAVVGNNTGIGYNTGHGIVTGINNTIIGANVTGLASALSDTVILADGAGLIRFYSDGTNKGKLTTAITSTKTLTLTSADTYNLTIPRTGTVGMVEVSVAEPTNLYAGFIWVSI